MNVHSHALRSNPVIERRIRSAFPAALEIESRLSEAILKRKKIIELESKKFGQDSDAALTEYLSIFNIQMSLCMFEQAILNAECERLLRDVEGR